MFAITVMSLLIGCFLVMMKQTSQQSDITLRKEIRTTEKAKIQYIKDVLQEGPISADMYKGKWKTTYIIEEDFRSRINYFPQHYLGRTVIIGDECIERSIWYWPLELDWRTEEYDRSEISFFNCEDSWVKSNTNWDTMYKIWGEEKMPFLRFYRADKEYCIDYIIILDERHLAYGWPGGYYLLEPFSWCNPDMDKEDIIGEWNVAFLDSYDETYEGGWKEIEETRPTYSDRMDELQGSDFYAEEWFDKKIVISRNELVLDSNMSEVDSIREEMVSREDFEREWGIHDGLSINNDTIKVVFVECTDGSSIPIIPVDKQKIIIHIGQGWFMLEKA